ncbi:baseplate J/gp47 family protein [Clostridium aminobutyricum]|uniref:Baseplate J/gp47 family protein n=2 Tax=Clostridium aminobutyricum TaxID=33953 RepID=A0A939IJ17_CLOAM|nr:baseplate J/gp47 family protein [Clostridium aminobutyricum]MBN7773143.1 baseplate J/gp47 family protein [Clostridium aminobutyricum]
MTYEKILADMMSRVTSDVDKREGSVIYDALAPCAYHLAQTYYNLNNFLDLVLGDTAVGEYLDRVVSDYGITRKKATRAVRQIETTAAVSIGTRWGISDTTYEITALLSPKVYSATCDQFGEIGNRYSGLLENIDNVGGVTATLTGIMASGTDEESDENLRARFYTQVQAPSTSGNANNYKEWALEVSGVGNVKVFPLWNGAGTVKVLVVDSDMGIDETLPVVVYEYIEKVRPIGAIVTIESPTSQTIDMTAEVMLDGIRLLEDIQTAFTTLLTTYLKESVFEIYNLSYAQIGSLLLSVEGVKDYSNLLVNGGTANITLTDEQIPVTGTVTLTEGVV